MRRETDGAVSRSALKSGLEVLQLLGRRHNLNLTEIANSLGKSKSGVHAILNTLRECGFVERITDGSYCLGARAWELGRASSSSQIDKLAQPFLIKLEQQTNEGVILGVLDGFDVLYLSVLPGNHAVRLNVEVGQRIPANLTSTGVCLLAALQDDQITKLLPDMLQISTPYSIATHEALWAEIEKARANGHAVMKRGWHVDVGGIAKCIKPIRGNPVAALCVSAPLYRVNSAWFNRVKPEIESAVRTIEDKLVK